MIDTNHTPRHESQFDRRAFIAAAGALGLSLSAGSALALTRSGQPSRTRNQPEAPAPADAAPPMPGYFGWATLADRALFIPGDGGNSMLLLSAKGDSCILIDAKMPYIASTLRREVEARGTRIESLVNTHHHLDHIGGNHAFTADIRTVAHAKAKARIPEQLERLQQAIKNGVRTISSSDSPEKETVLKEVEALAAAADAMTIDKWMPTQAFSGQIGAANLGTMPVDLHQVGPGHTDNDLIVHAPQLDVIHMGDLVFNNLHPFIDRDGGGSVKEWIKSLKYAKRLCKARTVVVPGHGDVTDSKGLDAMIAYFDTSMDFIQKQMRQKKTREEIVAMTVPGTEERGFPHLKERAMGAMYDELKG